MSIPAAFLSAVRSPGARLGAWLEVEGWPYAFGTFEASSSFFAGRDAAERFDGIKPWFSADDSGSLLPEISERAIDWTGGRSSLATATVRIVDADGAALQGYCGQHRTDGWFRLYTDASATLTQWYLYAAQFSTWPALNTPTTAYVGRECVTLTRVSTDPVAFFSGGSKEYHVFDVDRAQRRTRATAHVGRRVSLSVAKSPEPVGAAVSLYPRSILWRRCWLRVAAATGDAAFTDAASVTVLAGVVTGATWDKSGQVLALQLDDSQRELTRQAGRDWYDATVTGADGKAFLGSSFGDTTNQSDHVPISGLRWPSSSAGLADYLYARIDDEIVVLEPEATSGRYYLRYREALGTTKAAHTAGAEVVPLLPVAPQAESGSLWPSPFMAQSGVAGNHPLAVLLRFLLSTGTVSTVNGNAWVAGSNGDWDTLPSDWGAGIPAASVDVAGIVALSEADPTLTIRLPVMEPIPDLREWLITNCLRPFGYSLVATTDGTLKVVSLAAPSGAAIAAASAFGLSDVAVERGTNRLLVEGPTYDREQVVSGIEWTDSPTLTGGAIEPATPITFLVADEGESPHGYPASDPLEVEALGVGGGRPDGVGGETGLPWVSDSETVTAMLGWDIALQLIDRIGTRLDAPAVLLTVTTHLGNIDHDLGTLLSVTLPHLPHASAAARGLSATTCEVWRKGVDLRRGAVVLTLAQLQS